MSAFFAGLGVLGFIRAEFFGVKVHFAFGYGGYGFFFIMFCRVSCISRLVFLVFSWIFFSLFFATSLHRWFSF